MGLSKHTYWIIFLLYLPSKQTRIWLKNITNILFIRDIMTKNQQTCLRKNCVKQHWTTLRIWKSQMKHKGNLSNVFFFIKENWSKIKKLVSRWLTKDIAKSSKKKQTLWKTSQKTYPKKWKNFQKLQNLPAYMSLYCCGQLLIS